MFTVADMMTPNPHTLSPDHTLDDAKDLMQLCGIRHVPITNHQGELVGLISQRDILAAQESSLEAAALTQTKSALDTLIGDCMNPSLRSVDVHAGLKEAAIYMQKHKIGCLPILKSKQLIGIITDSDFVSIAINLLELQEEVDPLEQDNETLFDYE
ncbi:CBS domain-containing protein [Photobacterium damselae]|uniref:CBS domain-containing protein n=1 Tax=Photobacterium damselae TaxID=38293 RepID=UPI0040688A48